MHKTAWIVGRDLLDTEHVIADIDAIRRYNPQRFEMEQLTAIVHEDASRHVCIGYKDLTQNECWVRGHIPESPAMPMPLMCEAAAQLVNYYIVKHELCMPPGCLLGLRRVRCRELVGPGERLFVVVKLLRVRIAQVVSQFQCFVQRKLVCDGILVGGILPRMTASQLPTDTTTYVEASGD
ncbi:MAG: beta-hydroxyacyl-ACP dehydratase [Thermoguttaceae bacterium]